MSSIQRPDGSFEELTDEKGNQLKAKIKDRYIKVQNGKSELRIPESLQKEIVVQDNYVITSEYTVINFLPKNLWLQFHTISNLYFLFIGLLQLIPQTSTTNGDPSTWYVLGLMMAISAARAASEDIAKHDSDKARNKSNYLVRKDGAWQNVELGKIAVGDILKITKDQMLPADLVFISSANPQGHCHIDKANLNGETTLEVVSSVSQTRMFVTDAERADEDYKGPSGLDTMDIDLIYEPPNARFTKFRGIMQVNGDQPSAFFIDDKACVMRETNLRNTDWIIGIAAYTGNDTKLQVSNSLGEKDKFKVSKIMRSLNTFLCVMFVIQLVFSVISGILAGAWISAQGENAWYLDLVTDPDADGYQSAALTGFYAIFSWVILLVQLVPISLVVSAEMVKFGQSTFIEWDIHLYRDAPFFKPAKCNRSTIHEDLGLVDYVFSDKTGTLTQNKMTFRYCLLSDDHDFGSTETEIAKAVKTKKLEAQTNKKIVKLWTDLESAVIVPPAPRKLPGCEASSCCKSCWYDPEEDASKLLFGNDGEEASNEFTKEEKDDMLLALYGPPMINETKEQEAQRKGNIRRYLLHMALSNTVKTIVEKDEKTGVETKKYQAESAEEKAMVEYAAFMGFTKDAEAQENGPDVILVREQMRNEHLTPIGERVRRFFHVATFGFSSARARVTVVLLEVTEAGEGVMCHIMCKGQDSTVVPLINKATYNEKVMGLKLKDLMSMGLRTMVAAYSEQPVSYWDKEKIAEYNRVTQLPETDDSKGHRQGKCKGIKSCEKCQIDKFFNGTENECDLQYLGCIGLEDQLQRLVPDTIRDCLRAGIRVWMITGDKLETAKNIGLACNLIDYDMLPNFSEDSSKDELLDAFRKSRLIEITGAWATLAENDLELSKLFDIFDTNGDGTLDASEMTEGLRAVNCAVDEKELAKFVSEADANKDGMVNREEFLTCIKKCKLSAYDAVKYDIQQGVDRYAELVGLTNSDDHVAMEAAKSPKPVSILVTREAFQVMFPPKLKNKKGQVMKGERSEADLEELRKKFFALASVAKSVVFARAEPAMKKKMVTEIMARKPLCTTLAIGDGANDTDMIKAAHVGVGIAGIEGTAAVNNADYAIGQFAYLHTLLFVHGYWNYHRTSVLVKFIFYKTVILAIAGYWFCFDSASSGQQFFSDPPLQIYNLCYTALCIIAVGLMDQVVPREALSNNPFIYKATKGKSFNAAAFAGWIGRAFWHGTLLYYVSKGVCQHEVLTIDGSIRGMWYWSTALLYAVVMCPTMIILFEMHSVNTLHWLAHFSGWGSLFLFTWILNEIPSMDFALYDVVNKLMTESVFWLLLILLVSIVVLAELAWRFYLYKYCTTMVDYFRTSLRDLYEKDSSVSGQARLYKLTVNEEKWTASQQEGQDGSGRSRSFRYLTGGSSNKKRASLVAKEEIKKLTSQAEEAASTENKEKGSIIKLMLRFRNLTGGAFESAASHEFQDHHQVTAEDIERMAKVQQKSPEE